MPFPKNAHKFSPVIKQTCKPQLLELLQQYPASAEQLALRVGRLRGSVVAIMRDLHKSNVVHIYEWRKLKNNQYVPVWGYGSKSDAPNPRASNAPLSPSERKQTTAERHKDAYTLTRPYVEGPRIWGI